MEIINTALYLQHNRSQVFTFWMKKSAIWLGEATVIYYKPNEFAVHILMQNIPRNGTAFIVFSAEFTK